MIKDIAVYGTLRAGYGNHPLLAGSRLIATGVTDDVYTMRASGFPVVLENDHEADTHIRVEVYRITDEAVLADLDSLEGHPHWYRRTPVQVRADDGRELSAEMYIMQDSDYRHWVLVPTGDYADYRRRA